MTHFRERCEQICRTLTEAERIARARRELYPKRRVWIIAFEKTWMVVSAPREQKP